MLKNVIEMSKCQTFLPVKYENHELEANVKVLTNGKMNSTIFAI